jgi:anti-sigma regulatory factor (Ser/Thr protein kinase)
MVRVEGTRVAAQMRLQHVAGFAAGQDHLVEQATPVVAAALARGDPVALALRPATEQALRAALGEPEGLVAEGDRAGASTGSGQTTAARRARELRALIRDTGSATVLSEHTTDLDGLDGSFWTELDAAMNVACAELPVQIWCFFPEMPLHLEVLRGAWRNHPLLLIDGQLRHNPEHRSPREVLAETPVPAPLLLGPPDVRLTFTPWRLHEVRTVVEDVLSAAGYGRARIEDVVLAVNEIATNAVEHGDGEPELYLWTTGEGVVCEVHDAGTLDDPLPGLRAPHPAEPRGRGLWIARQLCDLLHVWRDTAGTHVRVRAAA